MIGVSAKNFFSEQDKEKIVNAIKEAEKNTSGEIRVHIENKCPGDPVERALYWFGKLKMHETELRNGVLFYLAVKSRKFAIIGDKGINKAVPDDFWEKIKENMAMHFRKGEFAQGLTEGILEAGEALKKYFPYQKDDVNELSDDISFGKN
jgi:uncharacterized membrane protein